MTRYQVITEKTSAGETIYTLRDTVTGARAQVAPALGGNCVQLALCPAGDEKAVAIIDDLQHIAKLREQRSRYGIPVLFPWPSGIAGGAFTFNGCRVEVIPPGQNLPTHHGYVSKVPWRVVRSDCDNTGAWVTCSISRADCGEAAQRWPWDFELELTWRLQSDRFQIQGRARNRSSEAMPAGLGFHPYFALPLGGQGDAAANRLHLTAERQWDLSPVMKIEHGAPAKAPVYFDAMEIDGTGRQGTPATGKSLNDVYLANMQAGRSHAVLSDGNPDGLRLVISGSKDFRTWVLYTPPDRTALSVEPWTLVPNGFNLADTGRDDSGIIVIPPGETWQGDVIMELES